MTKFHVEFDYKGHDGLDGWESPSNKENFVITAIPDPPKAGWYRHHDDQQLNYLSEEFLFAYSEAVDLDWFRNNYQLYEVREVEDL